MVAGIIISTTTVLYTDVSATGARLNYDSRQHANSGLDRIPSTIVLLWLIALTTVRKGVQLHHSVRGCTVTNIAFDALPDWMILLPEELMDTPGFHFCFV